MIFNKRFDLVISIGEDCACAFYLNKFMLRDASYPFDWLTNASFKKRIELINNDFKNFLIKDNLRRLSKPTYGLYDINHKYYEDIDTKFYFYHDFKEYESFDISYNKVNKKYKRRITRFYNKIKKHKNVLFVWWSRDKDISLEEISYAQKKISTKFKKNIYILSLQNSNIQSNIKYDNYGKYTIRVLAPLVDPQGTTLGNQKVSDKIFSQIKLSYPKQTYLFFRQNYFILKKVILKIVSIFVNLSKNCISLCSLSDLLKKR